MKTKLEVETPSPTEIRMTRVFDAPRHLVRRAMTEPALVERWLGGGRAALTAVETDLRVGGAYRQVFRAHDSGYQFTFTGVFRELSDERVVHTERFNDDPKEAVVTTTFTERDGRTTAVITMAFPDQETRDYVIGTGMADGAGETYDVLDDVLQTLAA